jgi:hypothetical protein
MSDDPLQQLLQAADPANAEPLPAIAPEALLAAACHRRLRRAGLRSAAVAALVLLVVAPLLTSDRSPTSPVRPTHNVVIAHEPSPPFVPAPSAGVIERELARLEREAAMHQQIIAAVLAPDAAEETSADVRLSDAELVRLETARSAALSLTYAQIAERDLQDVETARREYQRVTERFPDTQWSQVAAASLQRLAETHSPPST